MSKTKDDELEYTPQTTVYYTPQEQTHRLISLGKGAYKDIITGKLVWKEEEMPTAEVVGHKKKKTVNKENSTINIQTWLDNFRRTNPEAYAVTAKLAQEERIKRTQPGFYDASFKPTISKEEEERLKNNYFDVQALNGAMGSPYIMNQNSITYNPNVAAQQLQYGARYPINTIENAFEMGLGEAAFNYGIKSLHGLANRALSNNIYATSRLYSDDFLTNWYATMARRYGFYDRARLPYLIRRWKPENLHVIKDDKMLMNGRFPHTNFTYDRPVTSHAKGKWDQAAQTWLINPREIVPSSEWGSIEPSDMFTVYDGEMGLRVPTKDITIITGNPTTINQANQKGIRVVTNDALKADEATLAAADKEAAQHTGPFNLSKTSSRSEQSPTMWSHANAEVKKFGTPKMKDIRLLEQTTGMKADVVPSWQKFLYILRGIYPDGRPIKKRPLQYYPYNNLFYNASSPVEYIYKQSHPGFYAKGGPVTRKGNYVYADSNTTDPAFINLTPIGEGVYRNQFGKIVYDTEKVTPPEQEKSINDNWQAAYAKGIKKGGPLKKSYKNFSTRLSKAWGNQDISKDDYDYQKYYNDNPTEAYRQLRAIEHGSKAHFPDEGKSGTYKKPSHPTYPDLGINSWLNNDRVFNMSTRQAVPENTDRILDYIGSDLDYNNGSTRAVYDGTYQLPSITITPKGNYTELIPNELGTGWMYSDRVGRYQDLNYDYIGDYLNSLRANNRALGGNLFKKGGSTTTTRSSWMPTKQWQDRISKWEGAAMYKPMPDTGRANYSFAHTANAFLSVLPKEALAKLPNEAINALYSYAYNVGPGNFKKRVVPTLNAYLAGKASPEQLASTMWASKDKSLKGLRIRRAYEKGALLAALNGSDMMGTATYNRYDPNLSNNNDNYYHTQAIPFNSAESEEMEKSVPSWSKFVNFQLKQPEQNKSTESTTDKQSETTNNQQNTYFPLFSIGEENTPKPESSVPIYNTIDQVNQRLSSLGFTPYNNLEIKI